MRLLTRFYLLTLPPLILLGGIMAYHSWDARHQELQRSIEHTVATNLQTTRLLAANHLFQEFLILNRSFSRDPALLRLRQQVLSSFKDLLATSAEEFSSYPYAIALLDQNHQLVVMQQNSGPAHANLPQKNSPRPPSILFEHEQVTYQPVRYDYNGNSRLESFETLGYIEVSYHLPLEQIRQQYDAHLQQELFILALFTGLMVFLIFAAGHSIATPVTQLVKAAENISRNRFTDFALDRAPRELMTLAGALKTMVQSLNQNQAELEFSRNTLKSQLEFQQKLIDTVRVPIFYKDAKGRYLGCNQRFSSLVGLPSEKILGRTTLDDFYEDPVEEPAIDDSTLLAEGGSTRHHCRLRLSDGSQRYVRVHKNTYQDDRQQVQGLIGAYLDYTELKQTQDELSEQRQLLRSIVDLLPAHVYWKDPEQRYRGANQRFAQDTGNTHPDDLIGRTFAELDLIFDGEEPVDTTDRRVIETGQPSLGRQIQLKQGDQQHTLMVSKVPLTNEQGEIIGLLGVNFDISELTRVQRELQQKTTLLQNMLDHLPVCIYWKDADGCYQGGNLEFAHLMGLTSIDEIPGKQLPHLGADANSTQILEDFDQQVLTDGKPILMQEIPIQFPNEERTYLVSKVPLFEDTGRIYGLLGISIDISDRRKTERALAQQGALLRDILETIPANVYWKDRDLIYQGGNKKFAAAIGLQHPDELIGQTVDILPYTDAVRDRLTAMDKVVLDTGQPIFDEELDLSTDQDVVFVQLSKVPLVGAKGEVHGLLGISSDISARKKAERELAQSERQLRNVLDNLPVAVYWKDMHSHYLAANRYFRRLHNLSENDFVQPLEPTALNYPEEHQQRIRAQDRQLLETGTPLVTEFYYEDTAGQSRVFMTQKVAVYDDEGRINGLMGIDTDITDRKQAEEALQQAYDQLEQRVDERTADLQSAMGQLKNEISIRQRTEEALLASEERFRNLYNHTPVLMLAVGPDTQILNINDYLLDTLNFSRNELIGQPFACLMADTIDNDPLDLKGVVDDAPILHRKPLRIRGNNDCEYDVLMTASADINAPSEEPRIIVAMLDITERLRVENRLRDTLEQLEKLGNIVNHSPAVAFLWRAEDGWPVDYVSDNIIQFGYDAQQLTSGQIPFHQIVHPEDLERVGTEVSDYTAAGSAEFRQEYRLVSPEGKIHWIDDRTWVCRDEHGQATHYQGLLFDITEQRQAEEKLRETLTRLEDLEYIVDHSPAVAFLCRAEEGWPVEFVSSNINQFGYTTEDFLQGGLTYDTLIHPEDLPRVNQEMDQWAKSGGSHELLQSYRLNCADGQVRWIDDWNWVRCNEQGEITHFQGLILDVTDQHNAQLELQRVSDDLSRLINTANTPIIGVDHRGVINEWNLQAERITGYQRHEMLGQNPVDLLVVESQRHEVRSMLIAALKGRQVTQFEFSIINRDNQKIDTLFNVTSRLDETGKVIGVVGLGQDITSRKQAEQALQKARDRAEEANRAKSNFLATMSHEIRTPMNAIIGMTELTLQTKLDVVQTEYLESIRQSTHHLLNLVNDILDFSKIEAGKLELEKISFNLSDVLHSLARTQGLRAWQKGLCLDLAVSPHIPNYLYGDPSRLQQVLYNLTENALKFTDRLGISIQISHATAAEATACGLDASIPAQQLLVHFQVIDTGIGIHPQDQPRIFNSFQQSDSSTTRKYGGTGLGLAICKELVEAMGGRIWVVSEIGTGSRFEFIIPLQAVETTESAPASTIEMTKRAPVEATLLLAEDNPMNLKVASHFLQNLGYNLLIAQDGVEALELLCEQSIDLVLMDIEMPRMDGIEVTRRLRRGEAGSRNRHIPVLALTAHAFEGYREHCLSQGMDDFLTKPLEFNKLSDLLRRWLHHAKSFQNSESASAKTLDTPDALRRLEGDVDLLNEVRAMFRDELPSYQHQLQQKLADMDWAGLEMLAHGLKAPAAMIGASQISHLSRDLEQAAKRRRLEECRQLQTQLVEAFKVVADQLTEESK